MRFQTKLLILFALLFGAAMAVRSLLIYRSQQDHLAEFSTDIRNITKVVHFATERLSPGQARDRESLTRFITEAVEQNRALQEISIINTNQEIIASSNPEKLGKRKSEIWARRLRGELHNEGKGDWYEINIPITKNNRTIGQVNASILLGESSEVMRKLNFHNIFITSLLFLAVSTISFLALRRLTNPLRLLVGAARRVASGDFEVRVDHKGNDEHAEVALAFNSMIDTIRELRSIEERMREMERHVILSETAATLAHEIRNPLNLINLTAGRLAHKFRPHEAALQPEYQILIDDLKAQVKYLNSMVNDFLAVGKPLTLSKSTFLVTDLMAQTEMLIKQQLLARGIRFSMSAPRGLTMYADMEQLRLVLLNVLANAVAVSEQGKAITVQAIPEGQWISLTIRDNGPGIDPDALEKVFEPYYTKRPGGTGLGLTLARRIVEAHGGKISAINAPEGGAHFTVLIPRKEP